MPHKLVVVESPAKSRTLKKYLGKDFKVVSSVGHIIDLPDKKFGVDLEHSFEPEWAPIKGKSKVINDLKKEMKSAEAIYLASDPDREGEAISYHLSTLAPAGKPVHRVLFNAITPEVVRQGIANPTVMDTRKVESQFARRILDRIIGYKISPLLNRSLYKGLSAGRVQSAALRMVVDREEAIRAFNPEEYWKLLGTFLTPRGDEVQADLFAVDGNRVDKHPVTSEAVMQELLAAIDGQRATVTAVEKTRKRRSAPSPFITSTLQQAASSQLGLSPARTMRLAQNLYENGHITYMRTDSTRIEPSATAAAHAFVEQRFGKDYVGKGGGGKKGGAKAQDAHEAIRPTTVAQETIPGLDPQEARLYRLIWTRFVASRMAAAEVDQTAVDIQQGKVTFRANGSQVVFDGWFRVDRPNEEDKLLPPVEQGEALTTKTLEPSQHFTKPPSRYTEAGLIKALEKEGIGRPSTYASILSVLTGRKYVEKEKNHLIPTQIGEDLNRAMKTHFPDIVDLGFTADMEKKLDDIEEGGRERPELIRDFYTGFEPTLKKAQEGLRAEKKAAEIVTEVPCPKCGAPLVIRTSRFGRFLGCTEWLPKRQRTEGKGCDFTTPLPEDVDPAGLDEPALKDILHRNQAKDEALGLHPEEDLPVYVKDGPYGPYVQLGEGEGKKKPKRTSLPKGMAIGDVTLEKAISLLSLPRTLGQDPATGKDIKASIGRFGPYVQLDKTYASLKADDDVLSIDLARGLQLLSEKSRKNEPLAELGAHPADGQPVAVFDGRYGAYVKHGRTNATLGKDDDPKTMSLERAVELLDAKLAKGGGKPPRGRKPAKK